MNIHWFMTVKLLVMSLLMGGIAWYRFRRSRREPDQFWRVCPPAWVAGSFLFGAAFFLALLLSYGTPLTRDASQLAMVVVPAAALLGLVGGLVHSLVARSWRRRSTADPDYEDDFAENPVAPRQEPP
jgi:hypothetical protein